MSLKKIIALICSGAIVGLSAWFFEGKKNRNPASVIIPSLKPWAHSTKGKLNQAATITITPVNGVPDRDDQELTLKAEVTLHRSMSGEVQYQWELPEGAEIVSGHISDSWSNLKAGQTATSEISLINISKSGKVKTVNFHVSGFDSEVKYAVSGSFDTSSKYSESSVSQAAGIMRVGDESEKATDKPETQQKQLKIHQ